MKTPEDIIGQILKKMHSNKYSASFKSVGKWLAIIIVIFFVICLWVNPYLKYLIEKDKDNEASFEIWSLFFSFFFAVVGIIFSVRALVDSAGQSKTLDSQRKKLEKTTDHLVEISSSLPTRYIGAFPHHLNDIIELAEKSKEKFCIMTDCVDYGSFSQTELHEKLIQTIANVISQKRIDVQVVVSDKPAPISRSSPFFGKTFAVLCKTDGFLNCLERYLKYHPEFARPSNEDEFKSMLMRHHEQVDCFLRKAGAKIDSPKTFENNPGLFFWMGDDVDAVFLLSHTGTGTQGLAFRTHDAKLIEIFKSTFAQKLAEAGG